MSSTLKLRSDLPEEWWKFKRGSSIYKEPNPGWIPFEFIGTEEYVEKVKILDKKASLIFGGCGVHRPVYLLLVETSRGNLRIEVSGNLFGLLTTGEGICVSYQIGRWSKLPKGKVLQ